MIGFLCSNPLYYIIKKIALSILSMKPAIITSVGGIFHLFFY